MAFYCYNKNDYCERAENCDGCEVWVYEKGGIFVANMINLKDTIDTWNMIEKHDIKGYIQEGGVVRILDTEFKRLLAAVKNKNYILNLKA